MPRQNHPIWAIIRLSIYMGSLTFLLWLNASNFDETELNSIVVMFLVGGSTESVGKIINALRNKGIKQIEPHHPVWRLTRILIYMFTLCLILWMNASHFDETEGKTIIWMFIVGAGSEGLSQLLSKLNISIE